MQPIRSGAMVARQNKHECLSSLMFEEMEPNGSRAMVSISKYARALSNLLLEGMELIHKVGHWQQGKIS